MSLLLLFLGAQAAAVPPPPPPSVVVRGVDDAALSKYEQDHFQDILDSL